MSEMSDQRNPQVNTWMGRTVTDPDGSKIGTVTDVYVDVDTNVPDWLAVSTGLFGTKVSFVPVDGARLDGDQVMVAYDKDKVKDSPRTDADGSLSIEEEQALYAYYGRGYTPHGGSDRPSGDRPVTTPAPATKPSGDREASMVRTEEELSIDKHTQEAGRVKLRKWVETENVQVTVPVERQMARVVREPVRDGDTVAAGDFVEGEEEIVLSEEVVDVSKRAVAKERIGLEKETTTEQVPVNETVRKERVAVEGSDIVEETENTRR
jgi:uncharacterized protein (TIGR02271 family)